MNNALYQPSNLNNEFSSWHLSFDEYIEYTRNIITKARLDLTPTTFEKIIDANSPFSWESTTHNNKKKDGILLIHGLMDSPFSMRDLANYFLSKQFLVRSILLPGHGTVPGDLLITSMNAWIEATIYGIESLKKEVDNVFICGLSTGASLALHHAFTHQDVQGLFLFSPLIRLKTNFGFLSAWTANLGKYCEKLAWCVRRAETDYCKYESFPFYSAQQAYNLSRRVNELSAKKKLNCPMFMAVSLDDEIIDSQSAMQFFNQQKSAQDQLLIYGTKKPHLNVLTTEYRCSHFPEFNILNFSHVCLHIAPENNHYGVEGDYSGTLYLPKQKNALESSTTIYKGALTPKNLQNYALRRLTYNPDYSYLMGKLDEFLGG